MLEISAFGRLRQEDQEFEASLVYIVGQCLKKSMRDGPLLVSG
jgi:hypothetical protein